MDGSGALVGGDVVGGDAEDAAVEEGVLEGCAFECAAGEAGDDVGLRCGLGVIFSAHQIAVGDDGGEQELRRRCRWRRRFGARRIRGAG